MKVLGLAALTGVGIALGNWMILSPANPIDLGAIAISSAWAFWAGWVVGCEGVR